MFMISLYLFLFPSQVFSLILLKLLLIKNVFEIFVLGSVEVRGIMKSCLAKSFFQMCFFIGFCVFFFSVIKTNTNDLLKKFFRNDFFWSSDNIWVERAKYFQKTLNPNIFQSFLGCWRACNLTPPSLRHCLLLFSIFHLDCFLGIK